MAWTLGQPVKIGPQTVNQHLEVTVTSDSTTPTVVTHGLSGAPDEFYIRPASAGTQFGTVTANGLGITVTPSTAATTFVVVVKAYGQNK